MFLQSREKDYESIGLHFILTFMLGLRFHNVWEDQYPSNVVNGVRGSQEVLLFTRVSNDLLIDIR